MEGSIECLDALIGSGARRLTGYQRRLFMAEVATELCDGSARQAERRFGWGRETVLKGLHEARQGRRDGTGKTVDCPEQAYFRPAGLCPRRQPDGQQEGGETSHKSDCAARRATNDIGWKSASREAHARHSISR